ncbi:unnamed protein product [Caenorhabditis sp. 36 PRJEB53466]|nr:unnamed protein product [Caenorhabditis sp. 36 PRJEB53466]
MRTLLLLGSLFVIGHVFKFESDSSMRMTYCDNGWTRVNRTIGGWCVRVYQGVYNQEQAESACNRLGAVLSSIETSAERLTIADLGTTYMSISSGWKYGTLRLGIVRATTSSPFVSTDQHTSGTAGLTWSPGEPNGGSTGGYSHNCGMMWLWVNGGGTVRGAATRIPGTLFTMTCPITWNDRFRGFVCGKLAV